jgi:hypothetical protein
MAQLAHHIPALWHATTTTRAERKEMVRQLIPRGVVAGEGTSERLQGTSAWGGGGTTAGIITRPMSRSEPLRYAPLLGERLRTLAQAGSSTTRIPESLAQEGFHSPRHGPPCSRQAVPELRQRLGVPQPRSHGRPPLSKHAWWGSDFARVLGVAHSTRHQWRKRGQLQGRWHAQSQRWVAWADEAELQRLQQRCARPPGAPRHPMWLAAQRSPLNVSPHATTVSSQPRSDGMSHESNKQCLDDSIVVDTSITPFRGSFARLKST